jgi:hypothetical protein
MLGWEGASSQVDLAGSTGLEPAASGVTGRRSNQLNYDPKLCACLRLGRRTDARPPCSESWWAVQDSNL